MITENSWFISDLDRTIGILFQFDDQYLYTNPDEATLYEKYTDVEKLLNGYITYLRNANSQK